MPRFPRSGLEFYSTAIIILLATAATIPAKAQTAESQPSEGPVLLSPVVVTGRKIEEPIQRIPFGITVIQEEDEARETRRFALSTPGLNFTEAGVRTANTSNIRGVGSFLPLSFEDTSVPVFIDGVPQPLGATDLEFNDIERIEVLRGPQSTLGRNAQAGAISIVTADPTFEPMFQIGGEAGNLDQRRGMALANGPLGDSLAARASIHYKSRDGDVPDLNLGDDARDEDILNANGKLLWTPDDDTDVTFAFRYGYFDEEPVQGVFGENPSFPELSLDTKTDLDLRTLGSSVKLDKDLGFGNLTTITGLQYYRSDLLVDDSDGLIFGALTGFPAAFFNDPTADFRDIEQDNKQFTQEIRLSGESPSGLTWVGGLEFLWSESSYDQLSNTTGVLFGDFNNDFETQVFAAFGEATVPLTERLRLTAGMRVTHDRKEFDASFTDRSGAAPDFSDSGEDNFTLVTGRLGLVYDLLPSVSLFGTLARGAKSGGFQLIDTDLARGFSQGRFDTATTLSYEAGIRGDLFDERLSFSTSIFFNDTEDEHVPVFQLVPFQGIVANLDTETYGAEVEAVIRPFEGLSLTANLGLLQTEITKSDAADVSAGNEVPFAPSVTYSIGGQYQHPLPIAEMDGLVYGRVQYQFVGSRTTDPQNNLDLDSYDLLNLRLGWRSDSFSIYAFADNLLNNSYQESAFFAGTGAGGGPVSFAFPGRPRLYGLGATLKF